MRRQHKGKLTPAELRAVGVSRGLVLRRVRPSGNGFRLKPTIPGGRKKFYPDRKHMFASSEGG